MPGCYSCCEWWEQRGGFFFFFVFPLSQKRVGRSRVIVAKNKMIGFLLAEALIK